MGQARFHVERLISGTIRLSDAESRHASGSRRLSVGDELTVFDGCGHEAAGRIIRCGREGVEVELGAAVHRTRPMPSLTLAVALPKGPRQDTLIEKCAELGVAEIIPLETERSVSSGSDHRLSKWRRTTIEAAKQSGQCWIPEFHTSAGIDSVTSEASGYDLVLIADGSGGPMPDLSAARRVLAFVGPEGGWSEAERQQLVAAGATPVSLGPNILRIETAAMALAALVHAAQSTPADSEHHGLSPSASPREPDRAIRDH